MSDRQQLADKGTAFCLAALGIIAGGGATLATVLVPAAVLTAIGYEKWNASDRAIARRARKAAEEALRQAPDFSDADIATAVAVLDDTKNAIRFEPQRMAEAVGSGDLDRALFKDAFGGAIDDLEPGPRRAIELTLRAAFETFRKHPKYRDVFTQAMVMDLLQAHRIEHTLLKDIHDDTRAIRNMAEELVAREEDRAREFGIKEGMLIALARRYAEGNPADFDAALRELERALKVAAKQKRRGRLPANTDGAVNAIIARVDDLNDAGDIDAAADLIAEEETRIEAGMIRLYEKGIAQAILTRDVDDACAYELKALPLETPDPTAQFGALLTVADGWYERGRDKGLNFDLEVAIALLRAAFTRTTDTDERGKVGNNLGNALLSLGRLETGTERLEESVKAYRDALEERTRERVPRQWAMTQNNLGNALLSLGRRETGTERLEDAVKAYRDALEERIRERVPLQWAMTQNNLGNALLSLGWRETGTERLEDAVKACRAALEERTRERVPLQWAMTQNNLGNALLSLGRRETGTERLEEAVKAYRAALEERTRERVPLQWAMSQNNLGNALLSLGRRETGTERLEEAVKACRAALEERTRERVPLQWAKTQNNLGNALLALEERETGTERLEESVKACRAALEERTRERVPLQWATTQNNLGNALLSMGRRETGTERLEDAVKAYRAALEERTRERVPLDWAGMTYMLAATRALIAERTGALDVARAALKQARIACELLQNGGHQDGARQAESVVGQIEAIVSRLSGGD